MSNTRLLSGALALAFTAVPTLAVSSVGSLNTTGFSGSSGHDFFGESFLIPAGESGLISGTLMMQNTRSAAVSGVMSIRAFSDDGTIGTFGATLGSAPFTLPVGANLPITTVFNVPVVAGSKYVLLADWGPGGGATGGGGYFNSGYYADGTTIFEGQNGAQLHGAALVFSNLDMAFQVNFGAIPEPVTLGVLMPAVLVLRRRR